MKYRSSPALYRLGASLLTLLILAPMPALASHALEGLGIVFEVLTKLAAIMLVTLLVGVLLLAMRKRRGVASVAVGVVQLLVALVLLLAMNLVPMLAPVGLLGALLFGGIGVALLTEPNRRPADAPPTTDAPGAD